MNKWLTLSNQIDSLNQAISKIARWAVLLMLGLGGWNVIGRHFGVAIGRNLSSNALIESQWYLFDLVFLLGLSWTLQRQSHVRVDVLQGKWSKATKARIELLGTLFLLLPFAFGVMAISIEPALHSWLINEASPDPNGLPRYLVKALIPVSFFLLALQGLAEAIKKLSTLKNLKLTKAGESK